MTLAQLKPTHSESTEKPTRNKVLLVEDSRSIQALLQRMMRDIDDIDSLIAVSLEETRTMLEQRSEEIFLALLDLNLPDATGTEVVDVVREYGVPMMVLTGTLNEDLRSTLEEKNVLDYVSKSNFSEIEYVGKQMVKFFNNQFVKVLVVDDSPSFLYHTKSLVASYNYHVLTATTGYDALRIVEQHPDIALVITDYIMPGMTGQELITAIRQKHSREDMAIIGVSDTTNKGLSALLLKSGATDFINKPFQIEEFFCRVNQNASMISKVREIRELATLDYLTRVYNRHSLYELGESMYAAAKKQGKSIAAALIDADHFKKINDTYGHQVGDEALKLLASVLKEILGERHIVARFGGEEFVCLVNLEDWQQPGVLFESVRAAIEAAELIIDEQVIKLTVSIGVTTDMGENLDQMLYFSDMAVYKAKEAGRNRVEQL